MNKKFTVEVTMVQFGQPETGVWCDTCLLPSQVRFRFSVIAGMSVLSELTCTKCHECDALEWT